MKLNVKATAAASGLLWGSAVLTVGLINLIQPGYGREFLRLVSSIYPGYKGRRTVQDVAVGTAYALVDGAGAGATFAGLYNCFVACECKRSREEQPDITSARAQSAV